MVWFEFALCTLAIFFAGTRLAKLGDEIAEKTNLGRNWVGLILLATITSLPELISGVSAVTLNDLPDVAVGGVIGSCLFNVVILAILDLAAGTKPLAASVHHRHVLTAGFGIIMLTVVALDKIFSTRVPLFGWIDPTSLVLLGIYALAMRTIFSMEQRELKQTLDSLPPVSTGLTRTVLLFAFFALVIIVAALFLPDVISRIGEQTGMSQTFLGSSLLAISTSLPEVTVSIAAARIGAFDMAVANVLGSNLFNVAILAVEDIFYQKGSLLTHSSVNHVLSALATVICSAAAALAVTFRAEKKQLPITWDNLAITLIYLATSYFLFVSPS
jgi:cation:H+ antiporter